MRRRRASIATLATVAAGLVAPGVGSAATLSTDPGTGLYTYAALNGEANTLTITGDASNYTFADSVPITDDGGLCVQLNVNLLQCPRTQGATPMVRIRVELAFPPLFGPPDVAPNAFRYEGVPPPGVGTQRGLAVGTAFTDTGDEIFGSSGDDLIQSFGGIDTVSGFAGNDEIRDSGGASGVYYGGDGNDEITTDGPSTDETLMGGEGDDSLFSSSGADVLSGDAGADQLETSADDGEPKGDLLDGGDGADFLLERPGSGCEFTVADRNIGGAGEDTVYDDCGYEDVFRLTDGEPDKWHCGGFTGVGDLDPVDVLVAPKLRCAQGPETKIKRGPKVQTSKHTAKFKFVSSNKEADFQCKLDKGRFTGCKSPKKLKRIGNGKHVFQVRALAGVLPGKPAKYRWKVTENPR